MLRHDLKRMASALAAAALLWSAAGIAGAAGTTAGTVVSNTATVDYTVNAVVQPQVASLAADFMVDRRVDLTVTTLESTEVLVTPATANNGTAYTLTNTSNAALDFALTAANFATNPFAPPADNFDIVTMTAVVDNGDSVCDAGDVGGATTAANLAEDASVVVCVLVTIPGGQANDDVAAVTLTATAQELGGGALSEEAGADVVGSMQTVFADGDGASAAEVARDAAHSDAASYQVQSADVTIAKTETLISDPINNVTFPRHIPGAIVEYQVTVTNAAGSAFPATSLTISDVLSADVLFRPDTYAVAEGIDVDGTPQTNATGDDSGEFAAGTVTVTVPSLAAGASTVITFQVTVQ